MGLFLPYFPLNPPSPPPQKKNQNFEKVKKIAGDIIILHKCIKNHSHEVRFLRYGVRQADFFVLLLNNLENQNFEKMKKASEVVIILHVYQKSQSYSVCFLRYGVQTT